MRKDPSDAGSPVVRPHNLAMENRQHVVINGVEDVDSFNEEMIVLMTSAGAMTLMGNGLHISQLNLDNGQLEIDGQIMALEYDDHSRGARPSMISRLFK